MTLVSGVPECGERPSIDARPFGVEIETNTGEIIMIREALREAGIPISSSYDGWDRARNWYVKDEHCGSEVVSPLLVGEDGRRQVVEVCAVLRDLNARTGRNCGLHVHHDARDLSVDEIKRLYRDWYESESLIRRLIAPGRHQSHWCSRLREDDVRHVEQFRTLEAVRDGGWSLGRERSMNLCSYPRDGSIEIRLHQGSRNARKINAWTMFCQAFIDASRVDDTPPRSSINGLLDFLQGYGLPEEQTHYLKGRALELNPDVMAAGV